MRPRPQASQGIPHSLLLPGPTKVPPLMHPPKTSQFCFHRKNLSCLISSFQEDSLLVSADQAPDEFRGLGPEPGRRWRGGWGGQVDRLGGLDDWVGGSRYMEREELPGAWEAGGGGPGRGIWSREEQSGPECREGAQSPGGTVGGPLGLSQSCPPFKAGLHSAQGQSQATLPHSSR